VLTDLARFNEAEHYFDKYLEVDPKDLDSLIAKSLLLFNRDKKYDEALGLIDMTIQYHSQNPLPLMLKSSLLEKLGLHEESDYYRDKAERLSKDNPL